MREADAESEALATRVIGAAIRVHRRLGPGLLESVYEVLLAHELRRDGCKVLRQQSVSFSCDRIDFEDAFRVDLLVNGKLVVELKSIAKLDSLHAKQLLTCRRLMNLELGLLINFGGPTLRDGLQRVINSMPPLG